MKFGPRLDKGKRTPGSNLVFAKLVDISRALRSVVTLDFWPVLPIQTVGRECSRSRLYGSNLDVDREPDVPTSGFGFTVMMNMDPRTGVVGIPVMNAVGISSLRAFLTVRRLLPSNR